MDSHFICTMLIQVFLYGDASRMCPVIQMDEIGFIRNVSLPSVNEGEKTQVAPDIYSCNSDS